MDVVAPDRDTGGGGGFALTAPPVVRGVLLEPDPDQRAVIANRHARLRVLAGPGTGKTATLVAAVVDRIRDRGVDPTSVLVLTFSRRAAAELSDRLSAALDRTLGEPLVRTLHSYAYALLKAQAARDGLPAPRMLGAAETDRMVADLLAGHLQSGATGWPVELRPALGSAAFTAELRDLVLRTGERAIPPRTIARLGRRHGRPAWVAAADLAREYQQVLDLRMGTTGLGTALDQAELTVAALEVLGRDEVLAAEQARVRRVFVDEYQDVDPGQAALVERLAAGADELVVVGDPDQSIYGFRGSDPAALRDVVVDATVQLRTAHRSRPDLVAATRRIAVRLPGPGGHRELRPAASAPAPAGGNAAVGPSPDGDALEIRVLPTPAREAAFIADELRRAHLTRGTPWSQMAVLVRAPSAGVPAIARALSAAGVPMVTRGSGVPLDEPLAADLLAVLASGLDEAPTDGGAVQQLLGSPLLGADALDVLALRQVRSRARALLRHDRAAAPGGTAGVLADLVDGLVRAGAGGSADETDAAARRLLAELPEPLTAGIRRLVRLLRTARAVAAEPDAETALWQLWTTAGVEADLLAAVERGGRAAARADAALDAVVSLTHDAADLAARLPGAGVRAFVEQARARTVPDEQTGGGAAAHDAVAVLSAHAAKGSEWELVCVAGVQEGRWPDLRSGTGLLQVDELLDLAADLPVTTGGAGARAAEERRLFYVACTRARRRLVVTAVDGDDALPSRFLTELAGGTEVLTGWPESAPGRPRRRLHLVDLVAELRRAVCAPAGDDASQQETVREAARQLARLARAGVPGAHPDDWWALAPASSDGPAVPPGGAVTISPSAVESLGVCALRGVLERRGARGRLGDPQTTGIAVHAAAAGLAQGVPRDEVVAEIDAFLAGQEQLPDWQVRRLRRAIVTMTDAAGAWLATLGAGGWRTVGTELAVDLGLGEHDGRPVRLTGRVDLLVADADGRQGVVDLKTGASKVTRAQAAEHLQLAAYQLAVAAGAVGAPAPPDDPQDPELPGDGDGTRAGADPAGARLVYLRSGTAQELHQAPLDADRADEVTRAARDAAAALVAGQVTATENPGCDRCPVRRCCPLQSEGRQVTR